MAGAAARMHRALPDVRKHTRVHRRAAQLHLHRECGCNCQCGLWGRCAGGLDACDRASELPSTTPQRCIMQTPPARQTLNPETTPWTKHLLSDAVGALLALTPHTPLRTSVTPAPSPTLHPCHRTHSRRQWAVRWQVPIVQRPIAQVLIAGNVIAAAAVGTVGVGAVATVEEEVDQPCSPTCDSPKVTPTTPPCVCERARELFGGGAEQHTSPASAPYLSPTPHCL